MNTKTTKNSLDAFELYYEDMEKKEVAKQSKVLTKKETPQKRQLVLQPYVTKASTAVRERFNNVVKKVKTPRKKAKKLTKAEQKAAREQQLRGILGIGLLFVVVSIAYSSYVIFDGVSSTASRVMLVPQVVFAVLTLIKAFSKIYK